MHVEWTWTRQQAEWMMLLHCIQTEQAQSAFCCMYGREQESYLPEYILRWSSPIRAGILSSFSLPYRRNVAREYAEDENKIMWREAHNSRYFLSSKMWVFLRKKLRDEKSKSQFHRQGISIRIVWHIISCHVLGTETETGSGTGAALCLGEQHMISKAHGS